MAGDWIKMRTDLYRDPKVCVMAESLMSPDGDLAAYVNQVCQRDMSVTRNVMRNVTVGALVTVWGVARHRGKREGDNLFVRGVTISVLDDIADLPGFGSAMLEVGWVEEIAEGLIFPRFFEEFNVDPLENAKQKNAERQRRHREKERNVTSRYGNVTVTHREEKSREEKRDNTPLTPPKGECVEKPTIDAFADYTTDGTNPPPASRAKATFEAFWELFPNKANEAGSRREWKKLVERTSMPDSLLDAILAKVAIWRDVWLARPEDKRPVAMWWIQNERWKDPDPPKAPPKEESIEERMKRIREANTNKAKT